MTAMEIFALKGIRDRLNDEAEQYSRRCDEQLAIAREPAVDPESHKSAWMESQFARGMACGLGTAKNYLDGLILAAESEAKR